MFPLGGAPKDKKKDHIGPKGERGGILLMYYERTKEILYIQKWKPKTIWLLITKEVKKDPLLGSYCQSKVKLVPIYANISVKNSLKN